jgi:DHA3 family macrolide efflux protein-like MFS transporter
MSFLEDQRSSIPPESPTAPPDTPAPKVNFLSVLKNGGFRNLWLGQIVSQTGDYFSFLALTVIVSGFYKDLQETTLAVTGLMISFSLPRLLFGLLAGVFVDRWDRRITMLVSDIVRAGLALLMIPAFMAHNLLLLYALSFIMGAFGTLFLPSKGALIPNLVPFEQLLSANSLSQTSQMLAILIGPALAGFTLGTAGTGNEWVAFIVDSASFIVSAIAIWLIRIPKHLSHPATKDEGRRTKDEGRRTKDELNQSAIRIPNSAIGRVWQELLVGLKALVLNRAMATLAIIFSLTMLGVGAINVLWVIYLKTRFGFDGSELAWRFSLLDIVFGAGMIVASVVIGNFMASIAPKWLLVIALIGVGAVLVIFVTIPDYWFFLVGNIVLGIFVAPIEVGGGTLMQIVVPNSQLGRVTGGFATMTDSATILSMSVAGAIGSIIGIPMVFALGGAVCVIMGFASWFLLPPVTLKDRVDDSQAREAEPLLASQGSPASSNLIGN